MQGEKKRIVLVADTFPPLRTSGAVQMRDLVIAFAKAGHDTTMVVPDSGLSSSFAVEEFFGATVLRIKAPNTKNIGFFRRTIAEILLPFYLIFWFKRGALSGIKYDGLVWYSPTIFLGIFAHWFVKKYHCKSYLIVRDIFPQWAVDMGLMSRWGVPHAFFKCFEYYQYSIATVIGVITPGVLPYFHSFPKKISTKVEILYNWLAFAEDNGCSINLAQSKLMGRRIIVYAGNMGVSQGIDFLAETVVYMRNERNVGFVFVGRGLDAQNLRNRFKKENLDNVLVFNEIPSEEIPGLYAQCHMGALTLDPRHKTHNIPGKFLSYMQAGIPVVASVNIGNDLIEYINTNHVGAALGGCDVVAFSKAVLDLLKKLDQGYDFSDNCKKLFAARFNPKIAVNSIVKKIT